MEAQQHSCRTSEPTIGVEEMDIGILGGMSPSAKTHDRGGLNHDETRNVVGDRYVLQNRVGSGRLGEVYEAVDRQLDKAGHGDHRVIIELYELRPGQSGLGEQFASQFVQILSVSHSGIARIIDFGIDGTTVFFTTELLQGTSLRSVLDSSSTASFTDNEILGVLGSVADALRFTHAKGLVHGDLKPESVFITENFEVKIADFASAILQQALNSNAAEQNGISVFPGPADDVFGLATIAYEMLSDDLPFDGAPRQQAKRTGRKLRRIKGIPGNRWKALSAALDVRRGKRTPSIDQFVNQFGIVGTESIQGVQKDGRRNNSRLLLPLIFIAIVGSTGFFQLNGVPPGELLSRLQDRASLQFDSLLSTRDSGPEVLTVTESAAVEASQAPLAENPPIPDQPSMTTVSQPATVDHASAVFSPRPIEPDAVPVFQADSAPSESGPIVDEQPVGAAAPAISGLPVEGTDVAVVEPLSISFGQEFLTTFESTGMAAISIARQGAIEDEVSVIWWTADNSAIANQDYADLGARTETLSAGQTSVTIYVPLIVDSQLEPRESFYVYAGSALAPRDMFDRLEVFVIDNRN